MQQNHQQGLQLEAVLSSATTTTACVLPPVAHVPESTGPRSASTVVSDTGHAPRPLQPPHDVDALFREMDRLVRDDSSRSVGLRERSRKVMEQAQRSVDISLQHNDSRQSVVAELRRCALAQAIRDILAGRSGESCQVVGASPEANSRQRILTAIGQASFPEEYFRITEAMNAKVSNASRVAEAVSRDPALTALVLRLVNSPFYGLGSRVDSLQRAVAFTGFNELSALALAMATVRHFRNEGDGTPVPAGFWRRSILCGVLAKLLARRVGLSGEWFFVAGLLHDAGGLTARRTVPEGFAKLSESVRRGDVHPEEGELRYLGMSTAEAGACLLRHWGMAEGLVRLVEQRRILDRTGYDPGVCVLHLAEVFAAAMTAALPETLAVPRLDLAAWETLGLSPREVEELLEQAVEQAASVFMAFPA